MTDDTDPLWLVWIWRATWVLGAICVAGILFGIYYMVDLQLFMWACEPPGHNDAACFAHMSAWWWLLTFPYRWRWRARLPERHGQLFRVVARGALNSCLVEFEDGWRCVTSRNALRRA